MTLVDKNKVVWINLQGADWAIITPLLQSGHMPNLAGLINKGSRGQLFAVPPRRYPASAISLATGTAAHDHMVVGPVVADESAAIGLRPTARKDWARAPIWDIVANAGLKAAALGWPMTHPVSGSSQALILSDAFHLASGENAASWAFDSDCLSDNTLTEKFRDMRFHPQDVTADMLTPLLGAANTIDLKNDERLRRIIEALARTFTVHRAAHWIAAERPQDLLAVNFDFIEQLSQSFLQYQSPRMGHVTNADHARYKDVVNGAYTYFDQILGPYLKLAENIVVTSDHGYLTGDLRKRATDQEHGRAHVGYRDQCVFCASGPAFQQGQQVSGATTTSVAPTLLAALGLAAPKDMTGRAMANALTTPSVTETPTPVVPATNDNAVSDETAQLILAFLHRRGFLSPISGDPEVVIETVKTNTLTQLAQCNIAAQNYDVAIAQLEEARTIKPGQADVHLLIAQASVAIQNWDKAAAALQTLDQMDADLPMADYLRGRVAIAQNDKDAAKDHLAQAASAADTTIEGCRLLESVGTAYLNMKAYQEAADAFGQAIKINKNAPRALSGMGTVHLMTKGYEKALACFQSSLTVLANQPRTHALRGYALLGLTKPAEARDAFEAALSLSPTLDIAQKGLRQLEDQDGNAAIEDLNVGPSE